MIFFRWFAVMSFVLCSTVLDAQPSGNKLLEKGWAMLVKDNDTEAFQYFWQAYERAKKDNNKADEAESLLYLGICSFGASPEKGLQYATQALSGFKKLEREKPDQAQIGRSKCLQLISTIFTRQRKYSQAMQMSLEVVGVLKNKDDASGTLGLAYSSLGALYQLNKKQDSAAHFFKLALQDFTKFKNLAYLPNAYIKMAESAAYEKSAHIWLLKGFHIADSTQNKQALVSCLIALGKWSFNNGKPQEAETYFDDANATAASLSDKIFEIKALESLIEIKKRKNEYAEASALQNRLLTIKDNFYSLEREQIVKSLEVQFEVSEKDRKLALISKEREVAKLANYLLAGFIMVLIIVSIIGYYFFKSINKRDKQLLKTQEELVEALEKQKSLKEQQFQNDIEHKESQLSAITLQMLQKNESLSEIKSAIEKKDPLSEKQLLKMVDRHLAQDNSWNAFDMYFESVNKNFYSRLKQICPDISANDLKICALMKLNLSIKEMASILNISPDSVKTARYRLRKKLRLNTEDSLTGFILSV